MKEQQISYRDISEIHPYEHNPRNNDAAVEPVTQSIKNLGVELVLTTGAPLWAVCPGLFAGTLVVVEAGVFLLGHSPLRNVI